ncbi:MAG: formate dehydrogenase subunit delta [Dermatophilaceae bacterium]
MNEVPAVVRMANDIARQFEHLGEEHAAARVAGHVGRFWEMRMKVELRALGLAHDPALDPIAAAAARHLSAGTMDPAAMGTPQPPLPT